MKGLISFAKTCILGNSLSNVIGKTVLNKSFFSSFTPQHTISGVPVCFNNQFQKNKLLDVKQNPAVEQTRNVIKFSIKDGKKVPELRVIDRFFRLHWGGWIRTRSGRSNSLWKKSAKRKVRLLQHIFCTKTQCKHFDTMVDDFWRKKRYYIEDPYAPYHSRENFAITRKKPWRPEGVDYE